jgi:cysteine synthase B
MRHEDVLGLIGNTPLVGVHQLSPNPDVRIYAKLEGQNPGGSAKDRIALRMVQLAEEQGALRPGDTILEPSSGNTGIGLAVVAKVRGYKLRVVMPENVSVERRQLLDIFGAEIVDSPATEGSNGAIRLSEKLAADDPSLVAVPVRESRQPARALRGNRARDLARLSRGRRVRRRAGDERHLMGWGGSEGACQAARSSRWSASRRARGAPLLDDGFVPPIFDPRCSTEVHRATASRSVAAPPARRLRCVAGPSGAASPARPDGCTTTSGTS